MLPQQDPKLLCRSFGTYESKLWDDVFSEFEPITSKDVILVNFAAWYPRFKITEPFVPYQQWQESMTGALHCLSAEHQSSGHQ